MSIPSELAWVLPFAVPLIIGFLVGAVLKKASAFVIVSASLMVVFFVAGSATLAFEGLYESAMQFLPKIYEAGRWWINFLPYTFAAFLIGLYPGLLKEK